MAAYSWSYSNALLKTRFRKLVDAYTRNYPLWGMIKKRIVQTGGRTINHTVKYSPGGGAGATFSSALAGCTASSEVEFQLYWKTIYGIKQFDGLYLANLKSSEEAYVTGMASIQKDAFDMVAQRLETALYGNTYGSIGKISSVTTATSPVITLDSLPTSQNFFVNMKIYGAGTVTGGTSATLVVTKINRTDGKITVTVSAGTCAASQYLFPAGDASNMFAGLSAWIPATAPSAAETFWGNSVDRTVDIEQLAGIRVTGTSYTEREELLIDVLSEVYRLTGGKPDTIVCNPKQFAALVKELGSKVTYTRVSAQNEKGPIAGVGFDGVKIYGAGGPVNVVPDPWCPLNTGYALNLQEMALLSAGGREIPSVLDEDGNPILRLASYDRYEVRVGAYIALAIDKPGEFATFTFPTLT